MFHIYVGDEKVGTVSDPKVVLDYLEKRQEQMEREHPGVHMVLQSDAITYESEIGLKLSSQDGAATLQKLGDWLEAKAIGVDLWVDDKFIGIVKDQETVDAILARIESKYVPGPQGEVGVLSHDNQVNVPTNSKSQLESVEFVEEVRTHTVVTEPDQIADPGRRDRHFGKPGCETDDLYRSRRRLRILHSGKIQHIATDDLRK